MNCSSCTFELENPTIKLESIRTKKMAAVRNQLLRAVLQRNPTYLILIDLDMSCSFNAANLMEIDRRDDVTMVSYMPKRFFYDTWALRAPFYPHNKAGRNWLSNPISFTLRRWIAAARMLQVRYVDIWSAFGGVAVYRVADIRSTGCKYGYIDENGDVDCEHVSFNRCLKRKYKRLLLALQDVCT